MAHEAIEAVRAAELKARQIEHDGIEQVNRLHEQAVLRSEKLYTESLEAAAAAAERKKSEARKASQQLAEQALQKADMQIEQLKSAAESKKQAAVDLVFEQLF